MTKVIRCSFCRRKFKKEAKELERNRRLGYRNFCSPECLYDSQNKSQSVNCSNCEREVVRKKSEIKKSKSGRFFCNRRCSNGFNNRYRTGKSHPNYNGTKSRYRERALAYYGEQCIICGYGVRHILEVHHIDKDRSNNELNNLAVLCPTHHKETHHGIINSATIVIKNYKRS